MRQIFSTCAFLFTATTLLGCGGPSQSARRASRQLEQGNYLAAEASADKSLASHPADPNSWRIKIQSAMSQGQFAAAQQRYRDWKEIRGSHDRFAYRRMAITVLWQGLKVPSASIQAQAIQLVETHEVEDLVEAVVQQLGNEEDLPAAAAAIALITSHPAAPRLATELLRSADPKVRALVAAGIGKKVGKVAASDLLPLLKDPEPRVRKAVIGAIARWRSKPHVQAVAHLAASDPNAPVRARALGALLRIGGIQNFALAQAALSDPYIGARLAGLALLDKHGGQRATPLFEELLSGHDLSLALRAATALYRRDKRNLRQLFLDAYASPDWATRSAALNTVAGSSSRQTALELAGRGMADGRLEVRLAAARALIQLGVEAPALQAMREALKAPERVARLLAATDLAQRGHLPAKALLSRMVSAGTVEHRLAAVAAHKRAGLVTDGLVATLSDDNIALRLASADVLLSNKLQE